MEPCLFRHGKGASGQSATSPVSGLQWSHVFSDMVRNWCLEGLRRYQALQWSHVFSDMVRATVAATYDGLVAASMEPCLFRHGKLRPRMMPTPRPGLQWSHVFSDMVSQGDGPLVHVLLAASMEPCLFRHGKEEEEVIRRARNAASMEPCLFRHGKGLLRRSARCRPRLQWSHVFSDMVR